MIRSMTGFGQSGRQISGFDIQVEMKSVNHRHGECAIRIPKEWMHMEEALKKTLQQSVKRGRVDVFITLSQVPETEAESGVAFEVNWSLLQNYWDAAERIRQTLGLSDRLSLRDLLAIPDLMIYRPRNSDTLQAVEAELSQCFREALGQLLTMRETEGRHLRDDLRKRIDLVQRIHGEMAGIAPEVVREHASKLRLRIEELLEDAAAFNEDRIAMEIALLADRSNIDEELTRFASHCKQFEALLSSDEPVGRKMDFLLQEMNRETNTIGAKANHLQLSNLVVGMKAELEKIREQVQNIE